MYAKKQSMKQNAIESITIPTECIQGESNDEIIRVQGGYAEISLGGNYGDLKV